MGGNTIDMHGNVVMMARVPEGGAPGAIKDKFRQGKNG